MKIQAGDRRRKLNSELLERLMVEHPKRYTKKSTNIKSCSREQLAAPRASRETQGGSAGATQAVLALDFLCVIRVSTQPH